jgi:hypothetical protein
MLTTRPFMPIHTLSPHPNADKSYRQCHAGVNDKRRSSTRGTPRDLLGNNGLREEKEKNCAENVLKAAASYKSLRQASHFSRASSRHMNQCAFRHSVRSFPLYDSMNALSVGLPGREKSSVTPR